MKKVKFIWQHGFLFLVWSALITYLIHLGFVCIENDISFLAKYLFGSAGALGSLILFTRRGR